MGNMLSSGGGRKLALTALAVVTLVGMSYGLYHVNTHIVDSQLQTWSFMPAYAGTHFDAGVPPSVGFIRVSVFQGNPPQPRHAFQADNGQAECYQFTLPNVDQAELRTYAHLTPPATAHGYIWDKYCTVQPPCSNPTPDGPGEE